MTKWTLYPKAEQWSFKGRDLCISNLRETEYLKSGERPFKNELKIHPNDEDSGLYILTSFKSGPREIFLPKRIKDSATKKIGL